MPFLTVETNLSFDDLPKDFGPSLSKFTSETLNKPEEVKWSNSNCLMFSVKYQSTCDFDRIFSVFASVW